MSKILLLQGNQAVVEGAIAAGVKFFGGYPITPSTEVAESLAERLPLVGGKFIQMEDEIASMGAIIGAALTGKSYDRDQRTRLFFKTGADRLCLHGRDSFGHRQRAARRPVYRPAYLSFPGRPDAGPLGHARRSLAHCPDPGQRA